MKNLKNKKDERNRLNESKAIALHYMKTLVDVAREPFLILDADLRVISANQTFYQGFRVSLKETENKFLYGLGNGQWNIPELKTLLNEILPKKKVVKNYEVAHVFETIGEKTILLNARQIDSVQLIILAMEDITQRTTLEKKLAEYARELEVKVAERTADLTDRVEELETLNKTMVNRELKMVELKKEIEILRKRAKCGGGKDGKGKKSQ
jgi:nitrogen-specific signal transduction histidine kinase